MTKIMIKSYEKYLREQTKNYQKSQTVSVLILVVQLLARKRNVNLLKRRELDSWLLRWHSIINITLKIYTY